MVIKTSTAYQPRKIVYIYLTDDKEVNDLLNELKNANTKVLLHLNNWQVWNEQPIKEAYENKTYDYIIWPTQTSNSQKWAVLTINVKDKKAVIHTANTTANSKKEKAEISNLLTDLKDFKVSEQNPLIDTDDSSVEKDEIASAYLTIWYVKETLKKIKNNTYNDNYELDAEDGETPESDGKTALSKIKEVYDDILTAVKKLPTVKQLEENQEKHKPEDLNPNNLSDEQKQQLKTAKEKYKKEDSNNNPWNLTDEEKAKIDQIPNSQELEKFIKELEKTYAEQKESEKVNKWIKENISEKSKIEDLPKETDIDKAAEIPPQFKEEAKLKRWEREIELTPEPTTTEGKIKQHLTGVLYKWRKWEFLFDNNKKEDDSYIVASMFNQEFRGTIAKEMKPKIEAAIKTDTLPGYKELDKEWGENKTDAKGEVEYNSNREYNWAWKTLRELLKKTEVSQYDKLKQQIIDFFGEKRFQEIEIEAQIEVTNKSN